MESEDGLVAVPIEKDESKRRLAAAYIKDLLQFGIMINLQETGETEKVERKPLNVID